jgi:DNA-binding transcriptional MerR regulator
MDTKHLEAKFKELFSSWTQSLEEMRGQLADGKLNAIENFENQKEHLKGLIETMKSNLDKTIDTAEEQGKELKSKIEELNVQLNLGKAETSELFEMQRKKIDLALQEVIAAGKLAYHGNYGYMMELFDNNAKAIKTGLEIAQLQFLLAKMDVKDGAEKARKEMNEKLAELKGAAEKAQELTKDNMDHWGKQMKEGMEKMNEWMTGWTKK